ncbi:AAA family ATPase [Pediococcus ethanolidurans]|uniref:AAA family ATPase n=1 Tax=Pediococcus ethanolidurans TaxID=319653 RepID=UPI0029532ABF|nr:AAA family ATPase [Pediococcus ethanolidurans]
MKYYFSKNKKIEFNKTQPYINYIQDDWNDYGFETSFQAIFVKNGNEVNLGNGIHIGTMNQEKNTYLYLQQQNLTNKFLEEFPEEIIALGTVDYYDRLKAQCKSQTNLANIYQATNDIAFDLELFKKVKDLEMVKSSFFRDQSTKLITQLNRISLGGARYASFNWSFVISDKNKRNSDILFDIKNEVDSILPTNLFAIIGNNGVGKTSLLKDIVIAADEFGNAVPTLFFKEHNLTIYTGAKANSTDEISEITNLVFVSYSGFDTFNKKFINVFKKNSNFRFVGNREKNDINKLTTPRNLGIGLEIALERVLNQAYLANILDEIMDYFSWDEQITSFYNEVLLSTGTADAEGIRTRVQTLAQQLSSGQKIILISLSNLLLASAENALFLIDEPELYLHPPYALSLVLAINHIIKEMNAACIISTHSAIVLQEIPGKNVYRLFQSGTNKTIKHLQQETFGTNTQVINDDVFGIDIRNTGYYRILRKIADKSPDEFNKFIENVSLGQDAMLYLNILRRD